jgi:hypothetical protein
MSSTLFRARQDDIVVEQIGGDVLVYDRRADIAHCLGEAAALTWRTCDDGASLSEIAERIAAAGLASSDEAAAELADAAIAELAANDLLEPSSARTGLVTRRRALRRVAGIGAAAIAGPLVVSAAVPSAAAALSPPCVANGAVCTSTSTCCTSTYTCGLKHGSSGTLACCIPGGGSCTNSSDCCGSTNCTSGTCQ